MITLILKDGQKINTRMKKVTTVINAITSGKIDIGKGSMAGIKMMEDGRVFGELDSDCSWHVSISFLNCKY